MDHSSDFPSKGESPSSRHASRRDENFPSQFGIEGRPGARCELGEHADQGGPCASLGGALALSARGVLDQNSASILGIYGIGSSTIDFKGLSSKEGVAGEGVEIDLETGEIRLEAWSYPAALVERYALQAQARKVLLEVWRRDGSEGKAHGVTRCRRWLRPRGKFEPVFAEIHRHGDTGRTFFSGTEVCGSPWACPVCASKIAERRAEEIRAAVDQWILSGGVCYFVTLTVPHHASDSLRSLVQGFRKALDRFRAGRRPKVLRDSLGYAGVVRALEVTWGEVNGWHPHSHEIWFCRGDQFPFEFAAHWQDSAEASGFERPSWDRGLTVRKVETQEQARQRLAEYCTKLGQVYDPERPLWGAAEELTRAHSKKGRADRFTPWDFLRHQYNPETGQELRARYRLLFAEYVAQFRGLAQVFWSRGLKAQFQLGELSDEEVAQESREPADQLAKIEAEDWAKVIYRKDHRPNVLLIAQAGGAPALSSFLAGLPVVPVFSFPSSFEDSS